MNSILTFCFDFVKLVFLCFYGRRLLEFCLFQLKPITLFANANIKRFRKMNSTVSEDLSRDHLALEAAKCTRRLCFKFRTVISFVLYCQSVNIDVFIIFQKTYSQTIVIWFYCTRSY